MAGSLAPVMYWDVRTTLCSALRSDAEQLQYQEVMQLVRMLSMVQFFEDLGTHDKSKKQLLLYSHSDTGDRDITSMCICAL